MSPPWLGIIEKICVLSEIEGWLRKLLQGSLTEILISISIDEYSD